MYRMSLATRNTVISVKLNVFRFIEPVLNVPLLSKENDTVGFPVAVDCCWAVCAETVRFS